MSELLKALADHLRTQPGARVRVVTSDADQPRDLVEVEQILSQLPPVPRQRVLLMPQGITPQELQERGRWLVEACKQLGYRYCPRLHIELFGNRRGV